MNSDNTIVTLKTVADIEAEEVKFYIDAYQRGYRWTEAEVKALLDDIHEFSQSNYQGSNTNSENRFYCLQPIIVTKNKEDSNWKIIDGQQRMTTLYLIYLYYINTSGKRKANIPFELHYNKKEQLEKCLEEINQNEYWQEEELEEFESEYENDIDCYFIINAYKEICRFFNTMDDNPQLRNHINDMKKVFDNYMKIIWYELVDCNEEKEVKMFTKINMGKIPLTNAELIKALLLRTEEENISSYQLNIAVKWDEIESQLSNSNFWSFLVNDDDNYLTRIDFIFEIMAQEINEGVLKEYKKNNPDNESFYVEKAYNMQYFSFHVFNNYVHYLKKMESTKDYITDIGNRILEYYQMFSDWYYKRSWYHMIGYIVAISGNKYIEKLSELSRLYRMHSTEREVKGHKTLFEKGLRDRIVSSIDKKNLISNKSELEEYIKGLDYTLSNNKDIKNILLLYNICSLELLEEKTDARFPFDKYKNKEFSWDIEHINAVVDDIPNDEYDRENNECLIWLKNTISVPQLEQIEMDDGSKVGTIIKKIIDEKLYLSKNESGKSTFIKVFEEVINYFGESSEPDNSIGNLTLLDSGLNRSYKNDIFPLKRRKILNRCTEEVYVPLCTKNVFLKANINATDLLKWTQLDKDEYVQDIIEKMSKYLRLENNCKDE